MMRTILGEEAFRNGSDLYFERHDGQAVTCEDFVRAMEDASGIDLSQFRLWYSQAGTPQVKARIEHDAASATATLHLSQTIRDTPGQSGKSPMVLPLKTALIGADSGARLGEEQLILLEEPTASVTFEGRRPSRPLLSINRDFSAPVLLEVERQAGRTRAAGGSRSQSVRPLRGAAGTDAARADRRGTGRGSRSGAGDRRDARHAPLQLARPRVQGRGAVPADRKPDRRPDGAGRSRRHPCQPRSASAGGRIGAVRRTGRGAGHGCGRDGPVARKPRAFAG